jgi:hypothetical protein
MVNYSNLKDIIQGPDSRMFSMQDGKRKRDFLRYFMLSGNVQVAISILF